MTTASPRVRAKDGTLHDRALWDAILGEDDHLPPVTVQDIGRTGHTVTFKGLLQRLIAKFDESKHPRHPAGSSQGGEFAAAGGVAATVRTERLSTRMLNALRADGGFTIDDRTRDKVTSGFAVGVFPARSLALKASEITEQNVAQWLAKNRRLVRDDRIVVGGWVDKDTGTAWLDLVRVYPRTMRDVAVRVGRKRNQISIADLDAVTRGDWDHAFIDTGGTGAAVATKRAFRHHLVLFDFDADPAAIAAALRDQVTKWDESRHPRVPAGSPQGGQWTSGDGGVAVSDADSWVREHAPEGAQFVAGGGWELGRIRVVPDPEHDLGFDIEVDGKPYYGFYLSTKDTREQVLDRALEFGRNEDQLPPWVKRSDGKYGDADLQEWFNAAKEDALDEFPFGSVEAFADAHRNAIRATVNNSDVVVRVPAEVLDTIMDDNGVIRNQHEVGDSGGFLGLDRRAAFEQEFFFDGDYPRSDEPDDERRYTTEPDDADFSRWPIYGMLMNDDDLRDRDHGGSFYGDVVLVMKPSVKARSTFTIGDSWDENSVHAGRATPLPAILPEGVDPLQALPKMPSEFHRPTNQKSAYVDAGFIGYSMYFEAQIHGGLSLRDVRKILVSRTENESSRDLDDRIQEITSRLRRRGFEIPVSRAP